MSFVVVRWLALVALLASWSLPALASPRRRRIMAGGPVEDISDEIDIHAPDAPPGVLLLPGRKFPLDWQGGEFLIHGSPLIVREEANSGEGTGLNVWDGAPVLAKYLERHHPSMQGLRVVEVGCGVGVVGLTAAALGADVALTDLEYALGNTRRNIAANAHAIRGSAHALALDWFSPESSPAAEWAVDGGGVDLIVGADVVWVEPLIEPLAKSLVWLARNAARGAAGGGGAGAAPLTVLLAHQTRSRSGDALLMRSLEEAGFVISTVPHGDMDPAFQDPVIDIFRLQLRE